VTAVKRRALVQRRQVVGHSQETLARILGVEPTTVGRWERGETSPQPWCRPKLAEALGVSLEELDTMLAEGQSGSSPPQEAGELPVDPEHDPVLASPWDHQGTVKAAAVLRGGDRPVERRGFVFLSGIALTAPAHQWLVHEPGPLVSGLSGHRMSTGLLDRFTSMIAELRKMDDVAGGGSVLTLAQHEFSWAARLLDHARYDERTGRALHIVLAELGQLCGWAAHDTGNHGLAQRYYLTALRAAHSADDRPLGAHILRLLANQATRQGRPADAVTLIETAIAGTRGRQSPALLAELHIEHANAVATLRDSSACTAAISQARTQVEHLTPDDDPPWLYWMNPAEITVSAGYCLLKLGKADQAATMLDQGTAQFDESFVRDRQINMTRLADALARPGPQRDLDAAAGLGMTSIDLIEDVDSTRGIGDLHDLYHHLKPHAKVPAVRDFLERARGLVAV
jgi:DNA-binding XRE family transcriptional regulator/tetratricopeptide (TPR) repeat protein